VINATDEIVWEVQDQVQQVDRMVSWLVTRAGGDPAVIRAVPEDAPAEAVKAA